MLGGLATLGGKVCRRQKACRVRHYYPMSQRCYIIEDMDCLQGGVWQSQVDGRRERCQMSVGMLCDGEEQGLPGDTGR